MKDSDFVLTGSIGNQFLALSSYHLASRLLSVEEGFLRDANRLPRFQSRIRLAHNHFRRSTGWNAKC
jgi:hypothetical protein